MFILHSRFLFSRSFFYLCDGGKLNHNQECFNEIIYVLSLKDLRNSKNERQHILPSCYTMVIKDQTMSCLLVAYNFIKNFVGRDVDNSFMRHLRISGVVFLVDCNYSFCLFDHCFVYRFQKEQNIYFKIQKTKWISVQIKSIVSFFWKYVLLSCVASILHSFFGNLILIWPWS